MTKSHLKTLQFLSSHYDEISISSANDFDWKTIEFVKVNKLNKTFEKTFQFIQYFYLRLDYFKLKSKEPIFSSRLCEIFMADYKSSQFYIMVTLKIFI